MTYDEIVKKVASEVGLTPTFVNKIYRAYWKAIKDHITSMPLMDNLTDEEFLKLRPNVNVASLGKFYVTLDYYKVQNKIHEEILERKKQEEQDK